MTFINTDSIDAERLPDGRRTGDVRRVELRRYCESYGAHFEESDSADTLRRRLAPFLEAERLERGAQEATAKKAHSTPVTCGAHIEGVLDYKRALVEAGDKGTTL